MASAIELHTDAVRQAEMIRQNALRVPRLTQAQAKQADLDYHRAVLASCLSNQISPSSSMMTLKSFGRLDSLGLPASPPVVALVPGLEAEQLPVLPSEPPPQTEPAVVVAKPGR